MTTKSLTPQQLAQLCDDLLSAQEFNDYCPNGLQVDADTPIDHIVTGVTANLALINKAIEMNAQAILVHHGYFWKGEDSVLTGFKGQRVRILFQNNLSLIAYHLPLDAHPVLGNNAILAKDLDICDLTALFPNQKHPIGNIGTHTPINAAGFAQKIHRLLARKPLHIAPSDDKLADRPISRIAFCTGGAQDMIEQASKMGADAFISGEISERTTHMARELGIHYFAAGHHATERGGVRALGKYLTDKHDIKTTFVDIDNPV